MEAGNPTDEELWQVCRKLLADWEPHGQRKWHGKREARPDCDVCRWFSELFRTGLDWGVCCNTTSPRAGLLTHREQGCWEHEAMDERHYQAVRTARCDFLRRFEQYLREQSAAFVKNAVKRANDLFPGKEPPVPTPEQIRQSPLFVMIRRLLKHAHEDFSRPAFDAMAARAKRDSRRYWQYARCFWSRSLGINIDEIDLPENTWELEEKFWRQVESAIIEAFKGRESKPMKKNRRRAG
jgi:hypothetical protein